MTIEMKLVCEADLETYLEQKYESGIDPLTGDPINCLVLRQVSTGTYGVIDLLVVEMPVFHEGRLQIPPSINVIELKKDKLKTADVAQIARYRKAFDVVKASLDWDLCRVEVKYTLIGKEYDLATDAMFLSDQIDWLSVYTYSLNIDEGIRFSEEYGWRKQGDVALTKVVNEMVSLFADMHENHIEMLGREEAPTTKTESDDER